jgi:hypothetical protein
VLSGQVEVSVQGAVDSQMGGNGEAIIMVVVHYRLAAVLAVAEEVLHHAFLVNDGEESVVRDILSDRDVFDGLASQPLLNAGQVATKVHYFFKISGKKLALVTIGDQLLEGVFGIGCDIKVGSTENYLLVEIDDLNSLIVSAECCSEGVII